MPGRKTKKASKKNASSKENPVNLADIFSKYTEAPKEEEYRMHFADLRCESFRNWPFDEESSCNPKTLSEAGFYHIPTDESPDATRCFCCYKELDGWEPEDDPWSEHKKRSPDCGFLTVKKKDIMELTVEEFLKMEMDRQLNKTRKLTSAKIQEFDSQFEWVKSEMLKLNPTK